MTRFSVGCLLRIGWIQYWALHVRRYRGAENLQCLLFSDLLKLGLKHFVRLLQTCDHLEVITGLLRALKCLFFGKSQLRIKLFASIYGDTASGAFWTAKTE